jgi:ATP-dependent DNA helicase RecG
MNCQQEEKRLLTTHRYDADRLKVFGFIRKQVQLGRQVYIVYPLIEESEKLRPEAFIRWI